MSIFDISFISITENAAIKSCDKLGSMDKEEIDRLAVESMEKTISQYPYNFNIKSGEGAIDEAPELNIKNEEKYSKTLEIIVDPIEGTTLAANNQNGSISVMGIGEEGTFRKVPDMYAFKFFSPYKLNSNINIKSSLKEIVEDLIKVTNKKPYQINVAILDKPRHNKIIKEFLNLGVKISKISDGDVLVALEMYTKSKYDLFYGIGGAPEGIINAAIIKQKHGSFFMQLIPMKDVKGDKSNRLPKEEELICKKLNILINEELTIDDLIFSNDYIIISTGITDSTLLKGVRKIKEKYYINSAFINKRGIKFIESIKEFK